MVSEMAHAATAAVIVGLLVADAAWGLISIGGDHSNHGW